MSDKELSAKLKSNFLLSNQGGGMITNESEFQNTASMQQWNTIQWPQTGTQQPGPRRENIAGSALPSQRLPIIDKNELYEHHVRGDLQMKLNENSSFNHTKRTKLSDRSPAYEVRPPPNLFEYLQDMEQRFNLQIAVVHQRMDQLQTEFLGQKPGMTQPRKASRESRSSSQKKKKHTTKPNLKTKLPIHFINNDIISP